MKNVALFLAIVLLLGFLTSCADSKDIEINGKIQTIELYSWANEQAMKNDSVVYQVCVGNVVWDIIGCETIIIPVVLTGWALYEPVRNVNQK